MMIREDMDAMRVLVVQFLFPRMGEGVRGMWIRSVSYAVLVGRHTMGVGVGAGAGARTGMGDVGYLYVPHP